MALFNAQGHLPFPHTHLCSDPALVPIQFSTHNTHTHLCSDPAFVPIHHAQRLGVCDIPDLDLARLQQSRGEDNCLCENVGGYQGSYS